MPEELGGDFSSNTLGNGHLNPLDGHWHHIAVVFTPNMTTAEEVEHFQAKKDQGRLVNFYMDGIRVRTFKSTDAAIAPSGNYIGGHKSSNNRFDGFIHDIRLWDAGLHASEIAERMHVKLRGNEPSLAAHWDFSFKSIADISDSKFGETDQELHEHREYWLADLHFVKPTYPYMNARTIPGQVVVETLAEGHGKTQMTAKYQMTLTVRKGDSTPFPGVNLKIRSSAKVRVEGMIGKPDKPGQKTSPPYESQRIELEASHEKYDEHYIKAISDDKGQVVLELMCKDKDYSPELEIWADYMYPNERYRASPVKESNEVLYIPPPQLVVQSMLIGDYEYTEGDEAEYDEDKVNEAPPKGVYHVHLDAINGRGKKMKHESIEIWASETITILDEVEDKAYQIGLNNSAKFRTDDHGSLHLSIDTYNRGIEVPQLFARAGFMGPSTSFTFYPDEHTRKVMSAITGDQLKGEKPNLNGNVNSKNPTFSKVDKSSTEDTNKDEQKELAYQQVRYDQADDIAKAISTSVTPSLPGDTGLQPPPYKNRKALGVSAVPESRRAAATHHQATPQPKDRLQVRMRANHLSPNHTADFKAAFKERRIPHYSLHFDLDEQKVLDAFEQDDHSKIERMYKAYENSGEFIKNSASPKPSDCTYRYVEDEMEPGYFIKYKRSGSGWQRIDYVHFDHIFGLGASSFAGNAMGWNPVKWAGDRIDDAEKALKKAWNSFKDFVSDIADEISNEISSIISTIENGLEVFGEVVYKCVSTCVKFVGKIIEKIKMAIKKLIEFLKALFDWKEIIRVHKSIHVILTSGIDTAKSVVNELPTGIQQGMEGLKGLVEEVFGAIKKGGSPEGALAHMGRPIHQDEDSQEMHKSTHEGRSRWMQSKAKKHGKGKIPDIAMGHNVFDSIKDELEKRNLISPDLFKLVIDAIEKLGDAAEKLLHIIGSAVTFHGLKIEELLEVFEDVILAVIDLAEFVLVFLAQLIASGIDSFFHGITKTLHIPFVSWLYKKITGDALSILDIFSLIVAIPVHIIFVFEDKKFGDGDKDSINATFEKFSLTGVKSVSSNDPKSFSTAEIDFLKPLDTSSKDSDDSPEASNKKVLTAGDHSDGAINSFKTLNTIMTVFAIITGIFKAATDTLQGEMNMESMGESSHTPGARVPGKAPVGGEQLKNILDVLGTVTDLGLSSMWFSMRFWKEGGKFSNMFGSISNFRSDFIWLSRMLGGVADIAMLAYKAVGAGFGFGEETYGKIPKMVTEAPRRGIEDQKHKAEWKGKSAEQYSDEVSEFFTVPRLKTVLGLIITGFGVWGSIMPSFLDSSEANTTKYLNDSERSKLLDQLQFENIGMTLLTQPLTFGILADGEVAESSEGISPVVLGAVDIIAYTAAVALHQSKGYGSDL